ncbi:MMPL family transporter [Naumannella halotolerans]|uniref:MMPL family transporter n=1 Tax=Naumannella halotolerans TaxID=993414 RepID=UPI00370D0955
MSRYLYALGRLAFRRRGRVLAAWLLALLAFGGVGAAVMQPFEDDFSIPGAESMDALDQLEQTFPQVAGTSALVVVITPEGGDIEDSDYKDAIEDFRDDAEDLDFVDSVADPYDDQVEGLINSDHRAALLQLQLDIEQTDFSDADDAQLQEVTEQLRQELPAGSTADLGGEVYNVSIPGLSVVELLGVAIALVVLTITLGSIIAAGMPLITAIIGVAVSMSLLLLSTSLSSISSTTPMLAMMLGLAVGIDYALFIISRHRDQLRAGMPVEESAARAVATAGSAVVFAGLTVIIALCGLAVANIPFLTVMGGFAALTVALAVLIALTLLPALLGFAGERLRPRPKKHERVARRNGAGGGRQQVTTPTALTNGSSVDGVSANGAGANGASVNGSFPAAAPDRAAKKPRKGFFLLWVRAVTKVPILTVVVVVAALGALSLPAAGLTLALPNSGENPSDQPDRITYDLVTEYYGPGYNGPLIVTADIIGTDDPLDVMDGIADDIEDLPGVAEVPLATPNENADTGIVQVVPTTGPADPATGELVERLRAMEPEWLDEYDVQTAVTGNTAVQIDVTDRLGAALVPFGIFVVGLSVILLMMVFRSLVVPIKAAVGYLLSVGAAMGATTLVFNQGYGKELIHLEQAGPVISFFPILLMGILFGLAMDYEVFLVSRMREDYAHGKPARQAIEDGFVASAPVVVAAAVIMFSVFAVFVPEGEGAIKPIAFGLAVGVFIDAFIVRMILVPAVLAMLGDKAWWLPRWLDKALPSMDVEGERLAHLLKLSGWPADADRWNLYTEELLPGVGGTPLTQPVDLQLEKRQVLVIEADSGLRAPMMLALSGRMKIIGGQARVAGALLPDEASDVRRRTEFVDAVNNRSVTDELLDSIRSDAAVIFVDGADALHSHGERELLAELIATVGAADSPRSLVLGVADAALVDHLLAGGYHHLALRGPQPEQAPTPAAAGDNEPALAGGAGEVR